MAVIILVQLARSVVEQDGLQNPDELLGRGELREVSRGLDHHRVRPGAAAAPGHRALHVARDGERRDGVAGAVHDGAARRDVREHGPEVAGEHGAQDAERGVRAHRAELLGEPGGGGRVARPDDGLGEARRPRREVRAGGREHRVHVRWLEAALVAVLVDVPIKSATLQSVKHSITGCLVCLTCSSLAFLQ